MSKILLDYAFPISVITPTPAASTAFLKQAIVVAKPKAGQEANVGELFECTTMAEVETRTDNTNAQQLFNAGMSKVYILLADDLDIAAAMAENSGTAFTVLISDDFTLEETEVAASTNAAGNDAWGMGADYEAGSAFDLASETNVVKATLRLKLSTEATFSPLVAVIRDDNGGVPGNVVGVSSNSVASGSLTDSFQAFEFDFDLSEALEAGTYYILLRLTGSSSGTYPDFDYHDTVSGKNIYGNDSGFAVEDTNAEMVFSITQSIHTIEGLDTGTFDGVVGASFDDQELAADFAATENRCGFFNAEANGSKSMFFAFGSLLSNLLNWKNQQYIAMPFDEGVATLGTANSLFDDKVSFVISDDEFGDRLALFAAGGKAIVAPYILKNLRIDMQSKSLQWISANQPQYTLKEAALLEARLQEDVMVLYIEGRKWIPDGTVEVKLEQDNFVASGYINVAVPKALWRVFGEMSQTL